MINCKDSLKLLLEYADGVLPDDVRARLEEHFGGCEPCLEYLHSYRATPSLCKKALAATMPDEVAKKLMEFLRKEASKS